MAHHRGYRSDRTRVCSALRPRVAETRIEAHVPKSFSLPASVRRSCEGSIRGVVVSTAP